MTLCPAVSPEAHDALRTLLVELVKAALVSDEDFVASCRDRALTARSRLHGDVGATAALWDLAVREAEADLEVVRREDVNPMLPTTCPLDLSRLTARDFDFDACLGVIRESSSFG